MQRKKWYFLTLVGVALLPQLAAAATICLEAEDALTNASPMVLVRTASPPPGIKAVEGSSGKAYLEVPLGVGKASKGKTGAATFTVTIPADGAYTFWIRAFWEGECSNTFLLQIDDQAPFLIGADATYHAWHWIKYPISKVTPPPAITKGTHTLTFIHREDGVRLDQFLLTSTPHFVPVGTEKAGTSP